MSCVAARGTTNRRTAVAPIATTTIRTTGTTISDFVAPALDFAGTLPQNAGIPFFTENGSVHQLSPDPAPVSSVK